MPPKLRAEIFVPCFVDQIYPETGLNMVKVLKKLGVDVSYNPNQTCCGQPAFNAGYFDESREIARKFVDDFKNAPYIVCPSASCVGMVRNTFTGLLSDDTNALERKTVQRNIYEFSEFLTEVLKNEKVVGAHFPHKVTYHDSCSALRECKIKDGPRKLLSNVTGLSFNEMKDTETCCGFGGTFAVKFEGISSAMAEQKAENAVAAEAEYIVSTDLSCLMHIEAFARKQNLQVKTIHLADVLASGWS